MLFVSSFTSSNELLDITISHNKSLISLEVFPGLLLYLMLAMIFLILLLLFAFSVGVRFICVFSQSSNHSKKFCCVTPLYVSTSGISSLYHFQNSRNFSPACQGSLHKVHEMSFCPFLIVVV